MLILYSTSLSTIPFPEVIFLLLSLILAPLSNADFEQIDRESAYCFIILVNMHSNLFNVWALGKIALKVFCLQIKKFDLMKRFGYCFIDVR